MKLYREIDLNKWHMYVLTYVKSNLNIYSQHLVRPSTTTYEEYIDTSRNRVVTFEAAVMAFDHNVSLAEILIECSLYGIYLDFIEIKSDNDDEKSNVWFDERQKIVQTIDCHKEDVYKLINEIDAPRFYCVTNKNSGNVLKYLVVDRFKQDKNIRFLNGKYDPKAVVAGFASSDESVGFCKKKNES